MQGPAEGDAGAPVDARDARAPETPFVSPSFEQIYAETFAAVWRTARRMGVANAHIDDVVQEVYVVVHRNLSRFAGVSSLKTWVLAITTGVIRNYRRTWRRKGAGSAVATTVDDPDLIAAEAADPYEQASQVEAGRLVQRLLGGLSHEHASLFILVEIEGLTVPEIARALGANVNTLYARLGAARKNFERGLRQLQRLGRW
jgi:RNA polymerase sigma-70 factor (ECF subfamily)